MTEPLRDRLVTALGDQYDVEDEIGRGGMSVVYRARDRRLNRLVAIKVLPPELAYDPAIRTRFKREAQTAAQLSHAHIVPIYDVGERDGVAHFVMALITGGNLADLLAREPRQPLTAARRLLRDIADALAYAHVRGVIHRDIKPDNILLDSATGRAMVTDFGIARAIEAGTRLTITGAAVGTPTYMSPEQAKGEREIDGRSDIYSLGVIGYQMLTGRVPFAAGNPMALLLKHVGEPPRPIAELRPDAPQSLRHTIERSLMKEAEDRWPTASALRDALDSERGGLGPVSSSRPLEHRQQLRYVSPRPPHGSALVMEPPHLAMLTSEQREDLRLWNGRINLIDRIKAMRGYALLTLGSVFLGMAGFAAGVDSAPPLVLAPIVPIYMAARLWRRGRSLRASGLKLRRVLFMPRAEWALPTTKPSRLEVELAKLAPREVFDSRHGAPIRQAVEDRIAISEIVASLSKTERAMLPDLTATVNALVQRIGHLAHTLYQLDQETDPRLARRLAQQREDLKQRLESAGLALQTMRLDLIRFRSSGGGLQSALSDASSATQQARALSQDIVTALEAVSEVNNL